MNRITRLLPLAAALVGLVAPRSALHAQGKPTVAIMSFENGAFGKDRGDYEGLTKGVPGFLVTDMSANTNIRVIERGEVQKLVDEQKLTKDGHVDPATAVKVGKLLGAAHMIFGTFVVDPKGNFRIDARAVNVETGEIEHVERVDDKADNIMTAMGTLATKLNSGLKLPPMTRRTGDATPTPAPAAKSSTGAATAAAPAGPLPKLPMRVAVMYGKALDLADHGEKGKAVELFGAVLKEFPTYTPAQTEKDRLSKGA